MKAILWKELRENFRWALLGGVVLAVAEFYILAGLQRDFNAEGNITLTDPSFLMVVLFGSALIAGGLAAVQILPEKSRDRWAALLHRPVSRSVILGGKAVAGLGLYAAAVLLPFAASACYVAWPGKFAAPFVAGLLLAGFHIMAGGVAIYFGSLLLCLQRGRWIGTRGVVLLALGAVFVLQMNTVGPFLLLPVLAAAIFSLAAWHAMLGEDAPERGRWLRKAAFAAVALLGAQGALLLVGLGLSLLSNPTTAGFTYSRLEVTQDGQILRSSAGPNEEGQVVTDLAGNRITDERYVGNDSYQNLCQFSPLTYEFGFRRRGFSLTSVGNLLGVGHVRGLRLGNEARENWFLLVRQNYFVGYDTLSRRCIGICDQEGFKAPGSKPVPFADPLRGDFFYGGAPAWFWTDHRLYAITFFDRQLKVFFDGPASPIDQMMQLPLQRSTEDLRYVVLALESGIQVLDAQGRPVFSRPYLHDPEYWGTVEVTTTPAMDKFYLLSQPNIYYADPKQAPVATYLDVIDLHGNVTQSHDELLDNRVAVEPRWLTTAQACLLPILPAVLQRRYGGPFISFEPDAALFFKQDVMALDAVGWTVMAALAVALAAIAFAWARRAGFAARQAWPWALLVLAFGPAGLLAFRLAGGWPQRVRCPFCGRPRVLRENICPHCQHAWETPPPSGTEIFQPLAVQA